MKTFTKEYRSISMHDAVEVGSKNVLMGEMLNAVNISGILFPDGFAVTAEAFRYFIDHNHLADKLSTLMEISGANPDDISEKAKDIIMASTFPEDLELAITGAFEKIQSEGVMEMAVRSSAVAKNFPDADFANLHESFLNVQGKFALLYHIKQCYASLYNSKAIKYRENNGLKHNAVFMAVGVQQMVRADLGCSGMGFCLIPDNDFGQSVYLAGMWGMGEDTMLESVKPDESLVDKILLEKGLPAVVQKKLGSKNSMMVYADANDLAETLIEDTPAVLQRQFVLSDEEVEKLAKLFWQIEAHFKQPVNFEWAKDGLNHQLYIIQATLKKTAASTIPQTSLLLKNAGDSTPNRELTIG